MQIKWRRPTPSMVVAIIALVMSASGSAVAATALVSGDRLIEKGSLSANRLRPHSITAAQINLKRLGIVPAAATVRYASHAASADTATTAQNATTAGTAASAGTATTAGTAMVAGTANSLAGVPASSFAPVLYVHVLGDGTIDPTQSKNMAGVTIVRRATSAYCFSGLPFTPHGGSVAVDYARASMGGKWELAQLEIEPPGSRAIDCQAGESVEVSTTSQPGTFAPEAFYLVLYG